MMSRAPLLAGFIEHLAAQRLDGESLELVIAGDFVDFLAIEPQESWTPDASQAREKLEKTMREEPFRDVFTALGHLLAAGHELTILVGNHDVELALPVVQDSLLMHLSADPRQVRFVDDGRAYRIGGALVEHGNRYDGANTNDWDGLRAIVSAMSRFEPPPVDLRVSAGSRLVERVVNRLKTRYPFIDLLQPQGELTLLLALAFEPQLVWHWPDLCRLVNARLLEGQNRHGAQPGQTRHVAALIDGEMEDPELAQAFGDPYRALHTPSPQPVGIVDLATVGWSARSDSLSEIFRRGEVIPGDRLARLRAAMRKLCDDDHAARGHDDSQYSKAAERIRRESHGEIQVVVMGHTHLARHLGDPARADYINTGTWADIIRVPASALTDGADEELTAFLLGLFEDARRDMPPPTYGELHVEADGNVGRAALREWAP
jgi:UDP-2,3-diacylglucosamine pyrophosphatase LpxH